MLILILGVVLWWAAHLFKRVAPEARASMGDRGRGIVTVVLVLAVILMIWGYRVAPMGAVWWGPSPMMKGINNLLMLVAVYLFAADGMKTGLARRLRHPQLLAIAIWGGAHLLVNGDLPSLILFGGLLAWAVVEMIVINRSEPAPEKPTEAVPLRKDAIALVAAIVVYGIAGMIHTWLGYNPFGA